MVAGICRRQLHGDVHVRGCVGGSGGDYVARCSVSNSVGVGHRFVHSALYRLSRLADCPVSHNRNRNDRARKARPFCVGSTPSGHGVRDTKLIACRRRPPRGSQPSSTGTASGQAPSRKFLTLDKACSRLRTFRPSYRVCRSPGARVPGGLSILHGLILTCLCPLEASAVCPDHFAQRRGGDLARVRRVNANNTATARQRKERELCVE